MKITINLEEDTTELLEEIQRKTDGLLIDEDLIVTLLHRAATDMLEDLEEDES